MPNEGRGASLEMARCHLAQEHDTQRIQAAKMKMLTTILIETEVAKTAIVIAAVAAAVAAAATLEVLKETLSKLNLIVCEKVLRMFLLKWYKN